jgi:hypothetical protein
MRTEILIAGGGTGGVAAAMMACDLGHRVILTEETDWVGGQLTAQIVPPDEHPWIEQFGCTRRYREFRNRVRTAYFAHPNLAESARKNPLLNPGSGWVSLLCFEPKIGLEVIEGMLAPYVGAGLLTILRRHKPFSASTAGDKVEAVRFLNLESGEFVTIEADVVLDATELGDLLPMTNTEYIVGAESKSQTQEPNAVDGDPEWDNVQGITWCFALANDPNSERRIEKPAQYDKWKNWKPNFWPGPILGFEVLHAHTGVIKELPLYGRKPGDWYALFPYRQIVSEDRFSNPAGVHPATVVNWPQNDYFEGTIMDVDPLPSGNQIPDGFDVPGAMGPVSASRLNDSKQLSLSLLYWLQNDAPRHDDQPGAYPSLYMRPDLSGTTDGFAKYPYIREARRIQAEYVVKEQDVAAYTNEGKDRAPSFADSVGVGAYRIDLHPSTNGANTIDTSTLPFEIPLRSLVPTRMKNLIPACKNLGVTHITNGCYRLHPVEWNIGESAAALASYTLRMGSSQAVSASADSVKELQALLVSQGVELRWPQLRAL